MPPKLTTPGRELIREALPESYSDYLDQPLTKNRLTELATNLAKEDPDAYIEILNKLNLMAEDVVSTYGNEAAVSLDDLEVGPKTREALEKLRKIRSSIMNNKALTPAEKEKQIIDLGYKYAEPMRKLVMQDAEDSQSAFWSQISSGSRGNATQLMQMHAGNMLMRDALDRDIPYIAIDPYSEGVSPMAYWAGASSGRKGFYDTQKSTGQAGYLSKQTTNISHESVVSVPDCGTKNTGLVVKASDPENVGAVLLKPFKGHKAGEFVTERMLTEAGDDDKMIVRSPTTCLAPHGTCALCSGLNEKNTLNPLREYVALNASKAFGNKVTQAGVSCLHPGTQVRMADWSIKALKDIRIGDRVMGVNEGALYEPVVVTALFDKGVVPMYLTKFRRGFKTKRSVALLSTTCHKVLLQTQTSNCKEEIFNNTPRIMPVGRSLRRVSACHVKAPIAAFPGKQEPAAFFLGMLTGDGCYTYGVNCVPHFSCNDPLFVEEIEQYLQTIGMRLSFHKGSQCYWRVAGLEVRTNKPNPAKKVLERYGLLGKYAHEKKAPKDIFSWSTESALAYVSGLINTDGCLSLLKSNGRPYVSFTSTSYNLVLTLMNLLSFHCGAVAPNIRRNTSGERKRVVYSIVYAKSSEVLKVLENIKLYGQNEVKRIDYIKRLKESLSCANLSESAASFKRISQEYIGDMPALDIEVDNESGLFLLANGLIVSNSKHVGGVGGLRRGDSDDDDEGEDQPTGFKSLERLFSSPTVFPGGAILAPEDGKITAIEPAPQGGSYITIGENKVYTPNKRVLKVSLNDEVSAGDMLTDGVPSPLEVVQYKGLGEGRRYFTDKLYRTLKENGWGVNRRNVEEFSRAFINKVKITDDDGYRGHYPGDLVNYDDIAAVWKPRSDSRTEKASKALGAYLETPVLHYTIGTRITKNVAKNLEDAGEDRITVHKDPPPFAPEFVRSKYFMNRDKRWLARLHGERLRDSLYDAAREGMTDPIDSDSFVDRVVMQSYMPGQLPNSNQHKDI